MMAPRTWPASTSRATRYQRLEAGFSVVEALLAAAVLVVLAGGLLSALTWSRRGLSASVESLEAAALAAATLDSLARLDSDSVPVSRQAELVEDTEWSDASFYWRNPSPALRPTPSQLLGGLPRRPPGSRLVRLLSVESLPIAPGDPESVELTLVTVIVRWKAPESSSESAEGTVQLRTFLAPGDGS